jgi:uncharacterized protein (DUF433 family)
LETLPALCNREAAARILSGEHTFENLALSPGPRQGLFLVPGVDGAIDSASLCAYNSMDEPILRVAGAEEARMGKPYVEQREGGYWITGTRVSLDSLIAAFREGLSPEAIVTDCFPILTLAQAYGGIAYYLSHQPELDAYLEQADAEFEALRLVTHQADPPFSARLAAARWA